MVHSALNTVGRWQTWMAIIVVGMLCGCVDHEGFEKLVREMANSIEDGATEELAQTKLLYRIAVAKRARLLVESVAVDVARLEASASRIDELMRLRFSDFLTISAEEGQKPGSVCEMLHVWRRMMRDRRIQDRIKVKISQYESEITSYEEELIETCVFRESKLHGHEAAKRYREGCLIINERLATRRNAR